MNRFRFLFLAIPMAVTLGSCSNNEITEGSNTPNDGRKPIEVTAYTPRATRVLNAQEASISNLSEEGGGFSLTAKVNNYTVLIDKVRHYADAQSGTCRAEEGQIFYWPEEGEVSFSAYSPIDDKITLFDYGILYFIPDYQTDILAAYTTVNAAETDGTVSLNFQHVLAQVQMKVSCNTEGLPAGAVFTLDSISVYAPATAGVELNSGTITGNGDDSTYVTFYNSKTGADQPIILTDEPTLVSTAMIPASGIFKDSQTVLPKPETANKLTVAYTVTIGQSPKQ